MTAGSERAEKALVTGATGFAAGWCVSSLLERGYTVRATIRDAGGEQAVRSTFEQLGENASERLEIAVADLTRDAGWDHAVRDCRFVLHVASPLGGGTRSCTCVR